MTLSPEICLGDRYRLVTRIAVGGMGEVWRAHDQLVGRVVAVKVLRPEYAAEPEFLTRFRDEARHTAALSHPGIADVYDYGEVGDLPYLVMELVDGEPLSVLLAGQGRLPVERTLDIVGQAALALHAAHEAGVVHRDVKPGNLLVGSDGLVKVTDFGIARAAGTASMTSAGLVAGTAYYYSPEQASGLAVTPASDVYSLGVVAYECLAGWRPFVADNAFAIASAHVHEAPPPLPADVPEPVRDLVAATMAKAPGDRPVDARELARRAFALRDGLDELPPPTLGFESAINGAPTAGPYPALRARAHATRRRRIGQVLLAALVVVMLATLVLRACDRTGGPAAGAPVPPAANAARTIDVHLMAHRGSSSADAAGEAR